MTIEKFREVLDTKPFQPFTICLADGMAVPVVSREFVTPSPSGRTVVVFQPDDRMSILDLLLVTKLVVEPKSNGERARKKK
ncbi:MAG: hypothetical protein L0211_05175 [Planctomycetaceae bacterium]|nr:hypothetical protein [Planctomycetaceae bacterium]